MITTEQLEKQYEQALADLYALQGAIQMLERLLALSKGGQRDALTTDELAAALGAQSAEVIPNEN